MLRQEKAAAGFPGFSPYDADFHPFVLVHTVLFELVNANGLPDFSLHGVGLFCDDPWCPIDFMSTTVCRA